MDPSVKTSCTVANGQTVNSIGIIQVSMRVRDRVKMIDVVVVPELPHVLILGSDFWIKMGIVPDLRQNEWHFTDNPDEINCIEERDTVLTPTEEVQLNKLLSIRS